MKWNCKKIVIAATVMQLGLFCTADVATETVSEEKSRIIDDIVETKIKEAKGGDALSEVLDAVAAKMQLDTDKDTTEYSAYINELQEQTQKKYPLSDRELEAKYSPIAVNAYPTYNVGDKVSIVYQLHGKPFTVSGPFYRQDSRFVWVGSKKIPKFNLPREYADRFDPAQTKRNRAGFVQRSIDRYHQTKNAYLKNLKRKNADKIGELRGNILYEKKWRSPREVVMAKYAAVFARQENSIATAVQNAKDSPDYNERPKILESIIQKYPDHKSIAEVKALLQNFKAEYARKAEEVKNLLAYCSQPDAEPPLLKNQYGIDLFDGQLLSNIQSRFRGISGNDKLQNILLNLRQRILKASWDAIKELKINDSSATPQFTITKVTNPGNECKLFVLPAYRKDEVEQIYRKMENIRTRFRQFCQLLKQYKQEEAKYARLKSNSQVLTGADAIENYDRTMKMLDRREALNNQARQALAEVKTSHNEVKDWLMKECLDMTSIVEWKKRIEDLSSNSCSLSNIRRPLLLLVWEMIDFSDDFKSCQGWYKEIKPNDSGTWILR